MLTGRHEQLYQMLRSGRLNAVLNDLRRNPSEEYENYALGQVPFYAALAAGNPLTQLSAISTDEMKNMPCILVAPKGEEESEGLFFRAYLGVQGDALTAESVEEANLLIVSGRGYAPVAFTERSAVHGSMSGRNEDAYFLVSLPNSFTQAARLSGIVRGGR